MLRCSSYKISTIRQADHNICLYIISQYCSENMLQIFVHQTSDRQTTKCKSLVELFLVISKYTFLQVTWCGQVFNEPGTVLCTLISQTLAHLDPSLSSCITEFIKNESNIIGKLIALRQVRVLHHHIFLLNLLVTAGT